MGIEREREMIFLEFCTERKTNKRDFIEKEKTKSMFICRLMLWRFFKQNFVQKSTQILSICSMSSSTNEILTNESIRQRLIPYLDKTPNYVDELSQTLPRLKRSRRASILVPLFCNQSTNRIEVLLIKRSETMRSHTGMVGKSSTNISI